MSNTNNTANNFEASFKQLADLIQNLEEGDLPLDKAMETFEQGNSLVKQCQKFLNDAELKVEKILNEQGETETFESE